MVGKIIFWIVVVLIITWMLADGVTPLHVINIVAGALKATGDALSKLASSF